jgi:hypothetical protein
MKSSKGEDRMKRELENKHTHDANMASLEEDNNC